MAGRRILLTLNQMVHKKILEKAEDNLMTPQEYIADIIRNNLLSKKKRSGYSK